MQQKVRLSFKLGSRESFKALSDLAKLFVGLHPSDCRFTTTDVDPFFKESATLEFQLKVDVESFINDFLLFEVTREEIPNCSILELTVSTKGEPFIDRNLLEGYLGSEYIYSVSEKFNLTKTGTEISISVMRLVNRRLLKKLLTPYL